MEKVVYLLELGSEIDRSEFNRQLLSDIPARVSGAGGTRVQCNLVDGAVEGASGLRYITGAHSPDATISVWLHSAVDEFRGPIDTVIRELGASTSACLVTESEPLLNQVESDSVGRTPGFAQLAFLHRPERLSVGEWLDIWLNHHTRIAIDTQATFGYTQNIVARWLFSDPAADGSEGIPHYDAIVEELFPEAAMVDQHAFYDSGGDDSLLNRNRSAMMNSVGMFIDLDRIDVIATSQYRF
ncbi:MAG TPA: hypothetical protein VL068_04490 [Microthrixaceae bacterium]|nr:hypothetical protein [Microthrixaceae bacterium]